MQLTRIIALDHASHAAGEWISEISDDLGWTDRLRCYQLLRATLHAVRDYLDVNEAAALGGQLPTLIRGIFYEDWDPSTGPAPEQDMADFLDHICAGFTDPPLADPERAVGAVLDLIRRKITPGEYRQMHDAMSRSVTGIWK